MEPPAIANPFGILSLTPAAVTLLLAFWTRNVIVALCCGILSGAVVLASHAGDLTALNVVDRFLIPALGSPRYAQILLVYLWCLGGLLGLWESTGAAIHFGDRMSRFFRGRRGAKLFTIATGCLFHQGGTVSCVLTGATARSVAERNGVAPAELAFLLDSTASPVAAVIPLNVWPFYVAGLIAGLSVEGAPLIPDAAAGVRWYLASIPWNAYSFFVLLLTFLVAVERWPLARAWRTPEGTVTESTTTLRPPSAPGHYRPGLADFLVPLAVLLVVTFLPQILRAAGHEHLPYFGDRTNALNEAFLLATVAAVATAIWRGLPATAALEAFLRGCQAMTIGAIILGLAVTLGEVSRQLDPASYLASLVVGRIPAWTLPACFFLTASLISFATGSSFATYAVVLPVALAVACEAVAHAVGVRDGTALAQDEAVARFLTMCIGAVVAGGVFGDHCSPISDTTILASLFARCDVMEHTVTQLPIGLQAAAASLALYLALGRYLL